MPIKEDKTNHCLNCDESVLPRAKPMLNGFVENFNGPKRDEYRNLNGTGFWNRRKGEEVKPTLQKSKPPAPSVPSYIPLSQE